MCLVCICASMYVRVCAGARVCVAQACVCACNVDIWDWLHVVFSAMHHCILTGSSGARHFGYFNKLVYLKIPSLEWWAAHHTWAFIWVLEVLMLAGQALYVCVCVCEALEMSVLSSCLPVGKPLFYCPGIVGAWAQWPDSPWGGTIVSCRVLRALRWGLLSLAVWHRPSALLSEVG